MYVDPKRQIATWALSVYWDPVAEEWVAHLLDGQEAHSAKDLKRALEPAIRSIVAQRARGERTRTNRKKDDE